MVYGRNPSTGEILSFLETASQKMKVSVYNVDTYLFSFLEFVTNFDIKTSKKEPVEAVLAPQQAKEIGGIFTTCW